jgi:hypothetical protein
VGDRGQVDVGPFELTDRGAQDLALLGDGSVRGQLDDGIPHDLNLGRGV